MAETHQQKKNRSIARWALLACVLLALLYLALLIPASETATPPGANRRPFTWSQDQFWSALEEKMVEARAASCQALTGRIDAAVTELERLLGDLSGRQLTPEDPAFIALETNLFLLAPLAAACPDHLGEYAALVRRLRAEVKRQSRAWDPLASATRQRLYRLLYGARLSLEEVMLQAPAQSAFPQLLKGEEEPSRTPAASFLGVRVHSGDILVSRGNAPTSALIARGNDYPGSFSHVALVHVAEAGGAASVVEAHIDRGGTVTGFEKYLADQKFRIMVLRLRADLPGLRADPMLPHKAATAALTETRRRHIPYDFGMDVRDHRTQFCSEVVSAAYEPFGVRLWTWPTYISSPTLTAWLGSLGVRHFETQEPADLEYDHQLTVVAEWRDRSTLFKAHVDDAVTDVMLEQAPPGKPMPYPQLKLPFSRIAKAYSVLQNAWGKTGPVPEGMSATIALRAAHYRKEHARLAERVLGLAGDFQAQRHYAPPYWELVKLARMAKRELDSE